MIFGSVCSGVEAASLAWAPLGWRAAFLAEIDPFCRAVLTARFPATPLHGDFTTIRPGDYEPIDLLVGGTPCQSFSIAGLREGLADGRGGLALEYLRLADRLRPRWLVWENVPGVLSSGGGRDFGAILGGLAELGYGYAWRVLDARYFGVPQRRARLFVVGHLGDWRPAAAALLEPGALRQPAEPEREARRLTEARSAERLHRLGQAIRPALPEGQAPTLVHGSPRAVAVRGRIRWLTPLEYERAFGFPDGHTAIAWRGGPAPDGLRRSACGNSMVAPVMKWLGEQIAAVDQPARAVSGRP